MCVCVCVCVCVAVMIPSLFVWLQIQFSNPEKVVLITRTPPAQVKEENKNTSSIGGASFNFINSIIGSGIIGKAVRHHHMGWSCINIIKNPWIYIHICLKMMFLYVKQHITSMHIINTCTQFEWGALTPHNYWHSPLIKSSACYFEPPSLPPPSKPYSYT